jgi:hypothetical protein
MRTALPEKVALYAIGVSALRKAFMNLILCREVVESGMDK